MKIEKTNIQKGRVSKWDDFIDSFIKGFKEDGTNTVFASTEEEVGQLQSIRQRMIKRGDFEADQIKTFPVHPKLHKEYAVKGYKAVLKIELQSETETEEEEEEPSFL